MLELTCVFIALSIFMSIWYTYEKNSGKNHILAFGFLSVAFFDILHTFYFLKLNLSSQSYFDLSTRFWVLGRLVEAIAFLMCVRYKKVAGSKHVKLLFTVALSLGVAYLVVAHPDSLPILLTEQGVTPIKVFLEYLIIAIYMLSFLGLKESIKEETNISYKYIALSLLLSISSELCFSIYGSISSPQWTVGHVLKIAAYFSLFKGIFVSSVVYPYNQLETQHKRLEAMHSELTYYSNTMKDMLDALPLAVQKFDHDGKLKFVNKRFEELLECRAEELKELTIMDMADKFFAVSLDKGNIEAEAQRFAEGPTQRVCKTRKGKHVKLSLKSHKIRSGTLVILNDTKKEQELQELNIQTETILNAISNGVLMIDSDRNVVLCNKYFGDVYETDRKQIIGMNIDQLNEMTDFKEKTLPDKVLGEQFQGEVLEVELTSFKGNKKEVNLYVAPIRNVDGELIGAISIGNDVTGLKKEQQKMLQQEKLALLGQMGASIVHETRNFLTTIKGRCQLIDMISADENIKKHSSKINSDVEEVNRIISEFLFLSKPRETELDEISIHDVFMSIKSMLETSSLVKGVNIEMKLCDDERYMLCDESQLKQVILNMCKNATDAMSGRPNAKLLIETGYYEDTNESYIVIKDNGKGIDEESLKKIGTPFFTTKSNGTGLGLSVCYKIIKDHGGRIEVESQVNQGTAFTIILPCIEDEDFEDVI